MKLVIVPLALGELHDAAAFYAASANAELGLAFLAEFDRAVSGIWRTHLPERSSAVHGAVMFFASSPTVFSIRSHPTKFGSLLSHIIGDAPRIGPVAGSAVRYVSGARPNPTFHRTAFGSR